MNEIEQAIEFLNGYLNDETYTDKCINSHKLAIEALEKQIPKKIKKLAICFDKGDVYRCSCENLIHKYWYDDKKNSNYCNICGQEIDWSVEE